MIIANDNNFNEVVNEEFVLVDFLQLGVVLVKCFL